MYGGCTADVPEDAVRTPYRCRTDTVQMPYGHRTGVWGDVRRGTADTVRIPYRCRTDTVRAYGGCTARNRGWAWASRFECGVSRGATPLHTPCANSISPIMWMSRGCHTARFNNRGISYGYRTDIVRTYGGCTADVRRMYSEIPYGHRTGTVRIPYGYHGTPPSGPHARTHTHARTDSHSRVVVRRSWIDRRW